MGKNLRMSANCMSAEYIVELLEKVKDKGRKNEMKLKMCVLRNSSIHIHEHWCHKHMEHVLYVFFLEVRA
jgi:hypothetical protein